MAYQGRSFLEHTAIYVHDINWYIRFFQETLGMAVKKMKGSPEHPDRVWLEGGLQFDSTVNVSSNGRMAHIGIVTEHLEAALNAMYACTGVMQVPDKQRNWVRLPDGLVLEMFEQKDESVKAILSIVPRE